MRVVMEKISDCKECPYNQIQFNINYSPINICKKFKSNKKENTDGKEIKNTDLKNRKIPIKIKIPKNGNSKILILSGNKCRKVSPNKAPVAKPTKISTIFEVLILKVKNIIPIKEIRLTITALIKL